LNQPDRVEPPAGLTDRFRTAISWTIIAFCGAAQGIEGRFYVNPDGVSYLNMSDQYARGDWAAGVNTYWSPLYPLLIGSIRRLHAWPMYWESSIVHGINFAIYLASYACFRFMLRELTQYQRGKKKSDPTAYVIDWSNGWESVLAHLLFLWSALVLIGLSLVTPDMMIAAEVFLIVGLMLRIRRGRSRLPASVLLGVVLGLSYLTKAVMFPVAILVIVSTSWRGGMARWSHLHRLSCALSFVALAAPQVIAMSREVGRLSFGENGRIAYAMYVNLYNGYWTGTPPERGKPAHPVRQVLSNPPVFEFATDDPSSSYPYWDKPGYWLQGIRPHFDLSEQIVAIQRELDTYASGFAVLFLGALILILMRGDGRRIDLLGICIVAAGVLAMYALVHTEWRLVAAWVVVLFVALVSSVTFRDDGSARAGIQAVVAALTLWHLILTANVVRHATVDAALALSGRGEPHEYWTVAAALQELGLQRGQKVASIGRSSESYWARLAGVQIALEIPPQVSDRYWILDAAGRRKVNKVFTDHGATMAVASYPPAGGGPGWIRLGSSAFYGLPLTQVPAGFDRR
jgi:hypothetical protein